DKSSQDTLDSYEAALNRGKAMGFQEAAHYVKSALHDIDVKSLCALEHVITAIVLITAERGALPKLGETLAAVDGVSELYWVTGDFDFVAMVRAREHDELADIVTRRIAQVAGVAKTHTHVAFNADSRHDLESLFAIGAEEG